MKISLFCNAGMSTSILERLIQEEADKRGLDATVRAYNISNLKNVVTSEDIILIGPQIGHMFKEVKEDNPQNKVLLLSMQEFGMMDGNAILNRILEEVNND